MKLRNLKINISNKLKLKGKGVITPTIILLNAISMYARDRSKIKLTPKLA